MAYYEWIYIISIALQIAGALVLMLRFWGKTEKKVVNGCFAENNFAEMTFEKKIIVPQEALVKSACNIYLSRLAFIYIVLGYLSGVYGRLDSGYKANVMMLIIIGSVVFMLLGGGLAKVIAKNRYKESKAVDSNDIDATVLSEISAEDINNMFK